MTRSMLAVLIAMLFAGLTGCASGTKYSAMGNQMGSAPSGQGRIFFYRDNSGVGAAIQPDIKLNGKVVGKSKPGGFFFVDRPAGQYEVACSTETEKKLTFTLEPGEKRYVRTKISMGFMVGHVSPLLEDEPNAMKTLNDSAYIGVPLAAAK